MLGNGTQQPTSRHTARPAQLEWLLRHEDPILGWRPRGAVPPAFASPQPSLRWCRGRDASSPCPLGSQMHLYAFARAAEVRGKAGAERSAAGASGTVHEPPPAPSSPPSSTTARGRPAHGPRGRCGGGARRGRGRCGEGRGRCGGRAPRSPRRRNRAAPHRAVLGFSALCCDYISKRGSGAGRPRSRLGHARLRERSCPAAAGGRGERGGGGADRWCRSARGGWEPRLRAAQHRGSRSDEMGLSVLEGFASRV